MVMTVFRVRQGKESYIWFFAVCVLIAAIRFSSINNGVYLSTAIALFILALIWYSVFYYSKYKISDNKLLVKAIEGKKTIDVKNIRKVEKGNSIWTSGWFYFWYPYQKGLNIHYNKYDEIFINPEQQDEFIAKLLDINPLIEVK